MATSITDSTGAVFTITTDAKIAIDGVTDQVTANVTMLLYWYQGVYHRNTALDWWLYLGTPGAYSWAGYDTDGDPRVAGASPYGMIIPNLSGATQYGFQVFAINSVGTSDPSDLVTITTP